MASPDPSGRTVVLLVGSDEKLAAQVRDRLVASAGERFDVDRTDRLEEAIRRLGTGSIEAAILDLPDGDPAAVRRLKQGFPNLPAVVLTETRDLLLETDLLRSGAQDVVARDDLEGLGRALRFAIERAGAVKLASPPDSGEDPRRAEERVRLLESAVEQASDAISISTVDADDFTKHRFVYVNSAFSEITGYPREEVIGESPFMMQSPDITDEQTRLLHQALASGRTLSGENLAYDKDLSEFMMAWRLEPLRDDTGKVTHAVSIQRDVTEQRRLEEQLRQSQKMEAVGRLAGGVAHDFNNLLTAIIGYGQLLLFRLGPDHPQREAVEQIDRAAQRAASLTGQLLAFSRRQVLQPRVIDLNGVVHGIEQILRRLIGEDVDLVIRLSSTPAKVKADPGQLEQVLLNLSINARDAMPGGGRLLLESTRVEVGPGQAREAGGEAGEYVRVTVRDSGQGMDEETRAQIFEPFFTTKEQEGTGLGLATVHGIVKQSGGFIAVESVAGEGTTFDVYLPWVEHLPVQEPGSEPPPKVEQGSEHVLLAEDDDVVRQLVATVLEENGYRVFAVADGEQALAVAADSATPIDLLISDIVMPDMRGPELDRRIIVLRPDLRTLFISGYADGTYRGELDADVPFLQKPFSPETLMRKVRKVLDRPRPRLGPLVPAATEEESTQ